MDERNQITKDAVSGVLNLFLFEQLKAPKFTQMEQGNYARLSDCCMSATNHNTDKEFFRLKSEEFIKNILDSPRNFKSRLYLAMRMDCKFIANTMFYGIENQKPYDVDLKHHYEFMLGEKCDDLMKDFIGTIIYFEGEIRIETIDQKHYISFETYEEVLNQQLEKFSKNQIPANFFL